MSFCPDSSYRCTVRTMFGTCLGRWARGLPRPPRACHAGLSARHRRAAGLRPDGHRSAGDACAQQPLPDWSKWVVLHEQPRAKGTDSGVRAHVQLLRNPVQENANA